MKKNNLNLKSFTPEFKKKWDRGINNFGFTELTNVLEGKDKEFTISYTIRNWSIVTAACLVILSVFLFTARSYNLQILRGEVYKNLSDSNKTRMATIQPERGVIFDRGGEILVRNKPSFSLEMNTLACRDANGSTEPCKNSIRELSSLLDISPERSLSDLDSGKPIIMIAGGLTKEKAIVIESGLIAHPGVVVAVQPLRDYIYADAFSHVIGYVGLDESSMQPSYVGKTGLEKYYETGLQGIPGRRIIEVDSAGKSFKVVAEQNAFPGKNIHSHLDRRLQEKAFLLLKEKVGEGKAIGGAVVAQDPKTGGVLALVSYPAFEPNKMSYGISQSELNEIINAGAYPFFNRAVSATYAPGSTFKMMMASAALSEGVVSQYTSIFDPGYIRVGDYVFNNWKPGGHGDVSLLKAIQVSNDTYFYTIGGGYGGIKGLGIEKISLWANKFGYGELLGIDIEGESAGYMPDGESREWYLGDTYITSIGQGDVLSTPLQVNAVTAYFANGGYLMKPKIVKSIDTAGELQPEVIRSGIVTEQVYDLIREGMKRVVSNGGTAYPLFDFSQRHEGIELGGKTGTSEYTDSGGKDRTHAWLTAFGPFEDSTIALTVFLEGGGAGSDDASPIAKELLDVWFSEK